MRISSKTLLFLSGPLLFLGLMLFGTAMEGPWKVTVLGGMVAWMAIWWLTEIVPLAVTSLLPLIVFPLTSVMDARVVAPVYMKDEIFLFIGGFFVAFAMESWGLHKRIAIAIILRVGFSTARILLGFMVATWFISMWMSNTAATLVMLPTALGILSNFKDVMPAESHARFASGLLTGVAFSATIGGIATLVGTVPNLIMVGMFDKPELKGYGVSFATWFFFGFPLSILLLFFCYLILKRRHTRVEAGKFAMMRGVLATTRGMGNMRWEEKIIAALMGLMVALWVFMKPLELGFVTIPGWSELFPQPEMIRDSTVAMFIAILLFLIPSRNRPGESLLTWTQARKLPFDILLLFGGGFALAKAFEDKEIAQWLETKLVGMEELSPLVVLFIICIAITFFSELTSNITATQLSLPILITISQVMKINPLYLMIPATLSASFGFMLPVATPPNTIVYGTGLVRSRDMKRAGFILDLAGPVLLIFIMYLFGFSLLGAWEPLPAAAPTPAR